MVWLGWVSIFSFRSNCITAAYMFPMLLAWLHFIIGIVGGGGLLHNLPLFMSFILIVFVDADVVVMLL